MNTVETTMVPIASIKVDPKYSPRLIDLTCPESIELIDRLAGVPSESLPEVVVTQINGQQFLIGGNHRLAAARKRGDTDIKARLVHVKNDTEAYMLAVKDNCSHGMLLSLDDRKAIAKRLITEGVKIEEIATCLGVSVSTIQRYTEDERAGQRSKNQAVYMDLTLSDAEAAEKTGCVLKTVRKYRENAQKKEVSSILTRMFTSTGPDNISPRFGSEAPEITVVPGRPQGEEAVDRLEVHEQFRSPVLTSQGMLVPSESQPPSAQGGQPGGEESNPVGMPENNAPTVSGARQLVLQSHLEDALKAVRYAKDQAHADGADNIARRLTDCYNDLNSIAVTVLNEIDHA